MGHGREDESYQRLNERFRMEDERDERQRNYEQQRSARSGADARYNHASGNYYPSR